MDSDVPELEDFSDVIQISKIGERQTKLEITKADEMDKDNRSLNEQAEFGGFKKGFLSNSLSDKKQKKTDNVPFLKANPKPKSNLVFKEVQDEIKKNSWLTDDLLNTVSEDEQLSTWLSDPKTAQILLDFQSNPTAAILKYKDDEKTQKMLTTFGYLLNDHFNQLSSSDTSKANPNEIIIPGYEPNKPPAIQSSLDNKVQRALATPGVKEILLDPKIQEIIKCLRSDPIVGQRLIKKADRTTQEKLRLLVETGVLGMEQ